MQNVNNTTSPHSSNTIPVATHSDTSSSESTQIPASIRDLIFILHSNLTQAKVARDTVKSELADIKNQWNDSKALPGASKLLKLIKTQESTLRAMDAAIKANQIDLTLFIQSINS